MQWEDEVLLDVAKHKGIKIRVIGRYHFNVWKRKILSFLNTYVREPYYILCTLIAKFRKNSNKMAASDSVDEIVIQLCGSAPKHIEQCIPLMKAIEKKGYKVATCTNGADAIDMCDTTNYDIVFLDENMPGLTGLETLNEIKEKQANLPVVMITKSEEEYIMEEAIGNKIADYLIKPVNPNQILLSLKKNLDHSRLVSEKTTSNYQQEFRKIAMDLSLVNTFDEWVTL